MIIAVDGTAASGKGTLARKLAAHYGLAHLDTGSLYRAVAATLLNRNLNPEDKAAAIEAARTLNLAAMDDADLRSPAVSEAASVVAAMAEVRSAIKNMQVHFAEHPPGGAKGAVLDGRDIGTVICPHADVKIFVEADPAVRARRRFLELQEKEPDSALKEEDILADLLARDRRDQERTISPLKRAEDAHLLNTTNLSIEAAFEAACSLIDQARGN